MDTVKRRFEVRGRMAGAERDYPLVHIYLADKTAHLVAELVQLDHPEMVVHAAPVVPEEQ